ncbi:MAG: efflux RND transporter periplasmic adaptor subunit [Hyphomicrobium sp.]
MFPRVAILTATYLFGFFILFVRISSADEVALSPEQFEKLGITLVPAVSAKTTPIAVLAATVIAAPRSRIIVPSPFGGSIINVYALAGADVAKGDRIVTIWSQELRELQARLAQNEAEFIKAQMIAKRTRNLADLQVIPMNEALEAEEQVEAIKSVSEDIKKRISNEGIKVMEGGVFDVMAPEGGRISDIHAISEVIESTKPVAIIRTNENLWLDVQLPANLVSKVKVGDPVQIKEDLIGNVESVSNVIDRLTRSSKMLVSIPAGSNLLEGQLLSITLISKSQSEAMAIPSSAVAYIKGQPTIFIKVEAGFRPLAVDLLGKSLSGATVLGDLKPGQLVATNRLPELENMIK